jgi:Zn-finger nucleic acid-binding protein
LRREEGSPVVDACPRCGGAWYDRGELEQALAARQGAGVDAQPVPHPPRYLKCPVCADLMTPRNYEKRSGVIVDVCARHGAWLDAGELERLVAWTHSARAARAAQLDAEAAKLDASLASYGRDRSAGSYAADRTVASDVAAMLGVLFD